MRPPWAALEQEDDLGVSAVTAPEGAVYSFLKASAARLRQRPGTGGGRLLFRRGSGSLCQSVKLRADDAFVPAPEGKPAGGGLLAAALAGRLAAAADPSAALNGAVLEGITGLSKGVSRGGAGHLLQNGVAVLEMTGWPGRKLIRGRSTRTKTDGVPTGPSTTSIRC